MIQINGKDATAKQLAQMYRDLREESRKDPETSWTFGERLGRIKKQFYVTQDEEKMGLRRR